jgi:hypothetical protein
VNFINKIVSHCISINIDKNIFSEYIKKIIVGKEGMRKKNPKNTMMCYFYRQTYRQI